jgi:hypothetical protein
MAETSANRRLLARKLAFLSIAFGFVEYGLMAMREAERFSPRSGSLRAYELFLDELEAAGSTMMQVFLPTVALSGVAIGHVDEPHSPFNHLTSKLREVSERQVRRLYRFVDWWAHRARGAAGKHGPLALQVRIIASIANGLAILDRVINAGRFTSAQSPWCQGDTSFEAVLRRHGFTKVAEIVRRRRLSVAVRT